MSTTAAHTAAAKTTAEQITEALPKMAALPVSFNLAQFRAVTPLDESNLWEALFDRNSERIGVKRRESALENLEKIFVATFRLANTVGFRAMTLRDLCQETGLSMGGLYGYIENKDQLATMIEDSVRYVTEMLPGWFQHVEAPLDQMECILRAYVYLCEIFQPWLYFVFLESRNLPQAQRDTAKASELYFQSHIAKLIHAAGSFPANDVYLLAAHSISLIQDWHFKRRKFRAADISADAFARSVVQLIRSRIQAMSVHA